MAADSHDHSSEPQAKTVGSNNASGRVCRACRTPLEADQQWCLACGTAVASSAASRMPGRRATAMIAGLTVMLTGSAVAASYAALKQDAAPPAATAQVVDAEQPGEQPPAEQPSAPDPATATPQLPESDQQTPTLPDIQGQSASTADSLEDEFDQPSSSAGSLPTAEGKGDDRSGQQTATETTTSKTKSEPTLPEPQPLALKLPAITTFDPYSRITGSPPKRASLIDSSSQTAWEVDRLEGSDDLGVGILVDLGGDKGLRTIDLDGTAAKLEVYATDESQPPAEITDARWAHLKDIAAFSGTAAINLGSGSTKYRHLLIWFPKAVDDGPAVAIRSLSLTVR